MCTSSSFKFLNILKYNFIKYKKYIFLFSEILRDLLTLSHILEGLQGPLYEIISYIIYFVFFI